MIYKFRILLDAPDDVFRDIEIQGSATFEDFYNAINQSFGFDGTEIASFYESDDDWNKGEEISLFDMGQEKESKKIMSEWRIEQLVKDEHCRMLYVYDFFSLWTFFVDVMEITEPDPKKSYPKLVLAHGQLPPQAPERNFEGVKESEDDIFEGDDSFDDLQIDQNIDPLLN